MANRLLLADDSITIQKVVAIIFANEEFELTVVDNGTAALEKAREVTPDVMLVDALMPGQNGYEVCAEIRRDPRLGSVPILLLIGAFEPLDEDKARSCGADATISKPFESQQLIDKVKELLELAKSRKAAPAPAAEPAPRPLPLESAAEELWGDLSAFDTMAPVAPAAPAQPAQPQAPPAFQPAPVSEPAAPSFAAPQAPAAAEPFESEIVEVSTEDDLWGAFEVEELTETAAAPAEVFGVVEPEAEFEAEEFFSFEEEAEGIEETGPALEQVEEPVVQPVEEAVFGFAEEPAAAVREPEPFQLPEYEPFALETEPFAEPLEPEVAQAPALEPVSEPLPVMEPQSVPAEPAFAEAPAAAAEPRSLSEAELVAALSKVSKEVIERIVWEVVPDLAEVLIKEEIRKLKAGIRE